jgi:hypothetical protein
MPKDTELYDLLGVAPEATDIEYVLRTSGEMLLQEVKAERLG